MYTPLLQLENVSKTYEAGGECTHVLQNVRLVGHAGELILLLGPSGSGKTTLLSLVAGFLPPTSGEVTLFGTSLRTYSAARLQSARASRLGFIFQTFNLIDPFTVRENIELVQRFAGLSVSSGSTRKRTNELLARFGIEHLRNRYPRQLSQGEKQRVAIARAIANNAKLILADEPTASLSPSQGLEVIRLLSGLAERDKCCVVVASHDVRLTEYASRIFHIENGRVQEERKVVSQLLSDS